MTPEQSYSCEQCIEDGGHFWPLGMPDDHPTTCNRCGYNPGWNLTLTGGKGSRADGSETMSQSHPYPPPFTIGADDLPGVAKMAEEAGELVQVVGKLLATDGRAEHWDGSDLHVRLVEEAGDMLAAVRYFGEAHGVTTNVDARAAQKLALFRRWHEESQR